MSSYENKGLLFKNKRKAEGSKQPDYRGRVTIGGVDYELGGWLRDGKNGKFISLSAKPADASRGHVRTEAAADAPF